MENLKFVGMIISIAKRMTWVCSLGVEVRDNVVGELDEIYVTPQSCKGQDGCPMYKRSRHLEEPSTWILHRSGRKVGSEALVVSERNFFYIFQKEN